MTGHLKIDSHHHFWSYHPTEYAWIDDSMPAIRRDFLPEHLRAEIAAAGINGVVSVQARQSIGETGWLLDFAARNEFIKGVVGWVDLVSPTAGAQLERFAACPKLKGVRHVVQAEPDDNFLLRDDFNRGIRELKRGSLVYDILIFERQLRQAIRFVDAHPNQIFVLDHLAKPGIKDNGFERWEKPFRELARRENVFCKVSGMVTEADHAGWTEIQLRPYFETTLQAFTPRRLMFGSDWPVCLLACGYVRWLNLVSNWISGCSPDEQARIMGGTAAEAYAL